MGSTYRFLATGNDIDLVTGWFENQPDPPNWEPTPQGRVYHFEACRGIATMFAPRPVRGVLMTAGELHFLPTPLREQYPDLEKLSRRFSNWLAKFERVFSPKPDGPREWIYWLEAGIQNGDTDVFALPDAMARLADGQYYIADDATDFMLDKLCGQLRLRGVECEPA